jgi:hypothetical protein
MSGDFVDIAGNMWYNWSEKRLRTIMFNTI